MEHGGDVGCAGRERLLRAAAVTVTALIEGHAPEPGIDEDVDDRRPHLTTLTTGVEQQDGRPDAGLLPSQEDIRASDAPRPVDGGVDHGGGLPYLVVSR